MPELVETFNKAETRINCKTHGGEIIDPLLIPVLFKLILFKSLYQSLRFLKCDLWTKSETPCEPEIIN